MAQDWLALSIKQPWASLIIAGVKTIEIRTWPTSKRGPILIHTGMIPDERPEAWELIDTPELERSAKRMGGILGRADLVDCVTYESLETFKIDTNLHHNRPEWFKPPRMYGLKFDNLISLGFTPLKGNTFFFPAKYVIEPPEGIAPPGKDTHE